MLVQRWPLFSQLQKITEKPLYPFSAFASDVGGSLGLYIGAAIISGVEIIHLIILILYVLGNS